MVVVAYVIVALVALQRLAELVYAERNTAALRRRGAIEVGRAHYPFIILLHLTWLVAILAMLPSRPRLDPALLVVLVILQVLRVWVMASLGPYWTTRIITLKEVALVRRGPYRYLRHPNYVIVVLEIAVLPLAFGETAVAIVFSVLNGIALGWRIRQENRALAGRRALPDQVDAGVPVTRS